MEHDERIEPTVTFAVMLVKDYMLDSHKVDADEERQFVFVLLNGHDKRALRGVDALGVPEIARRCRQGDDAWLWEGCCF